jgi:putative RecB family exonuclease
MATLSEYRQREHWSYSALNQFLNICSLQFYFDRIAKLPRAFTPVSLSFGNAFHRVCEYVSMIRIEGKQPKKAEAKDLFGDLWSRQVQEDKEIKFDEDESAESCSKQGRDMIGCLVDGVDAEEQVIAVNEAFCVPLIDATGNVLEKPLIGEIDMVVTKAGKKSLVDWKTAANRWPKSKAAKDLQPTCFTYAYQQLHDEAPGFRFDVITKAKTPVLERHLTERNQDHFDRMVALVMAVEKAIKAESFLPSEQSFYCAVR